MNNPYSLTLDRKPKIDGWFWARPVLLIMLLMSQVAQSACPAPNGANGQFTKADFPRIVSELLDEHRAMLSKVPRLSPKEQEWLDLEINSGDPERQWRAWGSEEHARNNVINNLKSRVKILEGLQRDTPDGKTSHQIHGWLALIVNYTDSNAINHFAELARAGILDGTQDSDWRKQECLVWVNLITWKIIIELAADLL